MPRAANSMRDTIRSIASQIRETYIEDIVEIWGADTLSIVEEETSSLSTESLREIASEFQRVPIHPDAERGQILGMIDLHLKHHAVKNLDPLTGKVIQIGCY